MYPDLNSNKNIRRLGLPIYKTVAKESFNYYSSVPVRDFHPTSYAKHKIYVLVKGYHNILLKSRFINKKR